MKQLIVILLLLTSAQAQLPGMFSYFGPGAWGAYPGNLFYNYHNFFNYYNNMYTAMYPGHRVIGQFGQMGPMAMMGQFGPAGQFGQMGPFPSPFFGTSGPQDNDS